MAGGSTLDPDNFPGRGKKKTVKGHDSKALGPSDSSDSADAGPSTGDRIVGAGEAGLGGGLDQAEAARRGQAVEKKEKDKREDR
jgi:hypothetical protein